MKLIDILVERLPALGGWPIDSDDERTLTSSLTGVSWGLNGSGYYAFRGPNDSITYQQYEAARLAASKPEWDGEGLPPVGCRVEYTCKQPDLGHPAIEAGKWYGGTIIAYYDECVWTSDNGIRHLSNTIFRPLRSEEYNKRYAAIEALFEILDAGFSTSQDSIDIYDAIAAGKIPHIRID
ncbi:TPA: hypothetical protein ACPEY2_001669 [Citrobacter amalonaticus]